jgi:hypothetical protein
MNNQTHTHNARIFLHITLTFVFLAVTLGMLISGYWYFLLKPRLHSEASMAASLIAQAQAVPLADVLLTRDDKISRINVQTAIDKILLAKDVNTETTLVAAISLELDYEILPNPAASLNI